VTSTAVTTPELDEAKTERFGERLLGMYADAVVVLMLDLVDRTGLVPALAAGPGTSTDLVDRAGQQERYVRECLGGDLEDNLADPWAPWLYGVGTLHCPTVSLAGGGAGLGTVWGERIARQMLADAGFADLTVHDVPDDQLDSVYVACKGARP
jgi:hypothetical protein